jgi:hypothetical protein
MQVGMFMKLKLILFLYALQCAASEDRKNYTLEKIKPLFIASTYLEKSPGFESLMSEKILADCDPEMKAHKSFETYEDVEVAKRLINGGNFPLSVRVKQDIASMLCEHYGMNEDALEFLDDYAQKFLLHPISVEKIKVMMLEKRCNEFDYDKESQYWKKLTEYGVSMHEVTDS